MAGAEEKQVAPDDDGDDWKNSPGRARQMERFRWTWDFPSTHVREGHDCVSTKDREFSRMKGAKLTFGEVLDSGVGRMLHNLGAARKKKFHDLGMGPGKMLFQTYLSYPNMKTCMGVELSHGRYKLAEVNMTRLIKSGWRGRKFQLVECAKDFMKIVELSRHQHPKDGFKVGDSVVAYKLGLRTDKNQILDYSAKITAIGEKGNITVKYDRMSQSVTVPPKFVFLPESARTCEIWFGSLFDYPNNWDAEICILETDFPPDMHPKLIDGMCKTPMGCTFLTYHDLKKFDCFRHQELRQIDVNVYDSDRYLTSWSQGWRFYLWEHTVDPKIPQLLPPEITPELLCKEDRLRVFNQSDLEWSWAKPVEAKKDGVVVSFGGDKKETIKLKDTRLALNRPRFKPGQRVTTYCPEWVENGNFQLFAGTVKKLHPDGGVEVTWDEIGESCTLRPQHVFQPACMRYGAGHEILSCWTSYAVNKNSPERYRKFRAKVLKPRIDGLYEVDFDLSNTGQSRATSPNVREMWITTIEEDKQMAILQAKQETDPQLSGCVQEAQYWTPLCVSTMLLEATNDSGLQEGDREDYTKAMDIVMENNIDGKQLVAMKTSDLTETLAMSPAAAKLFMSRYMTWITSRMDRPASKSKRKRKGKAPAAPIAKTANKVLPGGGVQPLEGKDD